MRAETPNASRSRPPHPPKLESVRQLLFGAPLYAEFSLEPFGNVLAALYGRAGDACNTNFDAHCPYCSKEATFQIEGAHVPGGDPWNNIHERVAHDAMAVTCTRQQSHQLNFIFRIDHLLVQKIGQYPSVADVANDEVALFRREMSKPIANEFHRAIGLAAHGVGVGSFIYLRRVFERLVVGRFDEFRDNEGWDRDHFLRSPMSEKVEHLAGYLPEFLVKNARIYSILSLGVHELEEEECLRYFDVLKQSIIIMLEDDKKKRAELELRKSFQTALASIETK